MHDYVLHDLAHITIRQREREADEHSLGRAARARTDAEPSTRRARWSARFRVGPVIEPVRPAPPRARVVARRRTGAREARPLA